MKYKAKNGREYTLIEGEVILKGGKIAKVYYFVGEETIIQKKALEASAKYNRELVAENNNAKRKPEKVYSLKCTVCGKKITAKSLLTKYRDKCRVEKQRACMRAYKAKRK